jgi:hypothetical protein
MIILFAPRTIGLDNGLVTKPRLSVEQASKLIAQGRGRMEYSLVYYPHRLHYTLNPLPRSRHYSTGVQLVAPESY